MSMSLELTPPSKRVVNNWGPDRAKEVDKAERLWLDKVEDFLSSTVDQSFEDQKQPGGASWPPNSDAWTNYKVSQGGSPLINIYTGAMRDSIDTERGGSSVSIATPLDYAEHAMEDRSFMPTQKLVEGYVKRAFEQILRKTVE